MSADVVTGAFALGGPLIGAGSQVTIVYSTFAKNRARREKAEAARAAAIAAKRRPQYETLIRESNRGAAMFRQLRAEVAAGQLDGLRAGQFNEALSDMAHKIYVAATAIRIDGSPAARSIAANVITLLAHYADDLTAEELIAEGRLTSMAGMLVRAEEALVAVAADDCGS
jgi:hypothetical protein